MRSGPDIAIVASVLGDPARAAMLTALMNGQALTAGELAREAGVTAQTASSHVSRMERSGLVVLHRQGRHRYFALSGEDVAQVLEGLMGLAARAGHMRTRPSPREPALRRARVCYDHLAGELGVRMFDSLSACRHVVAGPGGKLILSDSGSAFVAEFGIDTAALPRPRRPICRECLDWSVRRTHLAGTLGSALLHRLQELGWAKRVEGTRIMSFSANGVRLFEQMFPATDRG